MSKDKAIPRPNPLVDEHPIDTLLHVQAVLTFIQEYAAKSTEEAETNPHDVRINTGLYAILRTVNDAIDFEIDRLDGERYLTVIQ